ncbi:hypothetical protein [Ruegeria arenilitoris]|uniref:hypothetical protein n=1 Tax=Ruegeria arenilitoris TaxID=1173585 RepID=UPI0014811460|nr:hypothetical protein [Ruegeria arenilitoris]
MSVSEAGWPFDVLGLPDGVTDKKTIRRGYARVLKSIDQERDAEAFQELRHAYEAALQMAEELRFHFNEALEHNVRFEDNTTPEENDLAAAPRGGEGDTGQANPPTNIQAEVSATLPEDTAVQEENDLLHKSYSDADVVAQTNPPHNIEPEVLEKPPEKFGHEIFVFDTDWDHVSTLCAEILKPEMGEASETRLRRLWEDPVFLDPEAAEYFEDQLYSRIRGKLTYNSGLPTLPDEVSIEYLAFLDEAFHWFSDSVRFQSRFSGAHEIVLAASRLAEGQGVFETPPSPKSWRDFTRQGGLSLRSPSNIILTIAIVALVAYFYSRQPDANPELVGFIALYGFVAVHPLQIPFLALSYWLPVEKVAQALTIVGEYTFTMRAWFMWLACAVAVYFASPHIPPILSHILVYPVAAFPLVSIGTAILTISLALLLGIGSFFLSLKLAIDCYVHGLSIWIMRKILRYKRKSG